MLFFFDHNVSSQLAQQEQFNLKKPPAYHYDFMLLSLMASGRGCYFHPPQSEDTFCRGFKSERLSY